MNSRTGTIAEPEFVALDTLMQVNAAWAAARYAKRRRLGLSVRLPDKQDVAVE
jgi:hypothetical protein